MSWAIWDQVGTEINRKSSKFRLQISKTKKTICFFCFFPERYRTMTHDTIATSRCHDESSTSPMRDHDKVQKSYTGHQSDKKPPNLGQTLNFLRQNRAERLKILTSKIEKIFRERWGSGGQQAPRGVIHPPFPSCNISFQEMVLSGAESLDFVKKWGNLPQHFFAIS